MGKWYKRNSIKALATSIFFGSVAVAAIIVNKSLNPTLLGIPSLLFFAVFLLEFEYENTQAKNLKMLERVRKEILEQDSYEPRD